MTTLLGKNCDGGHYTCSPPKECCKQGCCYLLTTSVYRPPPHSPGSLLNPLFLGHWYFWLAVVVTVGGILCVCSFWRRHSRSLPCYRRGAGAAARAERASEPDSNGSCYAPPQYSRCNSFHQPPPPYAEVASKPDLYPLVISFGGEPPTKSSSASTGYLMVQYFRNFIVRPVPTLSATSTIDSLSSSFICNAANEANTLVPPPYSCTGSLEEVAADVEAAVATPGSSRAGTPLPRPVLVSIRDNPCFGRENEEAATATTPVLVPNNRREEVMGGSRVVDDAKCQTYCDASSPLKRIKKPYGHVKLPKERSQDSELSQDSDHNFSDLLNLSVCMPNSVTQLGTPIQSSQLHELQYSVTNSMTGSDISSLANLGSPDSPPRATSPTLEMRELLDKIQQLPQPKSPVAPARRGFHCRAKAKTLYMPLYDGPSPSKGAKIKGWLSRSAPSTPCGAFAPAFPPRKAGSKLGVGEGSERLLREHDEEDANRDECS